MGVLFNMFRRQPKQTQTDNIPKFERFDLEDQLGFRVGKTYPLGKGSGAYVKRAGLGLYDPGSALLL